MKTFAAVLAATLFSSAMASATEQCTRSLLGAGPELGPLVCTKITSTRGTTVAIREAHESRSAGPQTPAAEPEDTTLPPVGSMTSMDQTGFSRRGTTDAGDPRRYCGENQACQQWYVDNAYIAQNGEVRMKQPWLYDAAKRGYRTRYHPNIVLHPAR